MNLLCQRLNLTSLDAQLPALLDAARQQQLSYQAFLELALTTEVAGRQQRAQERRLRAARLPFVARLDSFDFRFQPSVSERLMRELASLAFLQTATNVLLLGDGAIYTVTFVAQCALLLAALVPAGPLRIARYYVAMTAAIALGLWDWLRTGTPAGWEQAEGTR